MHGWETRMLLRHYLQRGVSKAALARRFGVSRRTIHEWVETGQLDRDLSSGSGRYSPRPAVPHKLAPYTGIVEARLEEFPGLSAKRLFDEVRAAGYPGGYSRVRDYVRAVRPREPVEAAALIDRLLHHCHIVNIRGNSYRMREHQHWLRTASDEQREGVAT